MLVAWLVYLMRRPQDAITTVTAELYLAIELVENVLLTGIIAGRLWWINKRVNKILPGGEQPHRQSLVGIILESAVIVPIMILLLFPAGFYNVNHIFQYIVLNPCILTQTTAIVSILIVIRIGLAVNDPPADPDLETPNLVEIDKPGRNKPVQAVQPFQLKYNQ
ncbi:hypothetical protein GYMLUDRAFT_99880 [Collybiopsis luxurians FD-317 M1]|uniref:Uncharacterized protein n=1 Tax=Collybiopsis luxurians FD-317 M1 TaxID=944289 RepID=A0A0D0C9Q6_9AGAR|nr:hypothetical protein GYMLUDRAFT_99880 [Collybiopsis luxurians FD-317 M1]